MSENRFEQRVRPEVAVAAKWWAQWLRDEAIHDNGDDSFNGAVAQSMIGMIQANERFSKEQADLFEEQLAIILEAQLKERADDWRPENPDWGSYGRVVDVDYGPCMTLRRACEAAGLKTPAGRFPWKTVMWVDPGKVAVRNGYGAETQVLYSRAESN